MVFVIAEFPLDASDIVDIARLHQIVDDLLLVNFHVRVTIVEGGVPELIRVFLAPVLRKKLAVHHFIRGQHPDELPNARLHLPLFAGLLKAVACEQIEENSEF